VAVLPAMDQPFPMGMCGPASPGRFGFSSV
jgi:hypothetical protein